jgi:hypothetical protein|tara:strand:+ start:2205 stop:2630 length:426 start_codon:yes stop_codon:yes gene_type:complete
MAHGISQLEQREWVFKKRIYPTQPGVTAKTTSATLTAAEMLTGIITGTHSEGSTQTYTTPTGTLLEAAMPGTIITGSHLDVTFINLSAALADTITIAGGSGISIVGQATVDSAHADSEFPSSGTFRFRRSAANTFVGYRIN